MRNSDMNISDMQERSKIRNKEAKMWICCLLLIALCRPVFSGEWTATIVRNLDALVSSCVVVPCSFSYPGRDLPASRLRAMWHHSGSGTQRIYNDDSTLMLDSFKGRTRLLGDLGKKNCTLEITDVKNHDNGPFCFRIELVKTQDNQPTKDMFSFVDDCVSLNMLLSPPTPTLTHQKVAYEGDAFTVTCTVPHTCPSHVPKVTWDLERPDVVVHYKDIRHGNWEVQSILTIIPEEKDDHREITCSAEFNGARTSSKTMTLFVKRAVTYNHIIIPIVVLIGTAVVFGLLCVLMARKYRKRITELQNQEGTMWNRLSKMSRRVRR